MKGDTQVLHAARFQARESFRKNAAMQEGDPALGPAIAHAEEVAKILRENVVQVKRDTVSSFLYLHGDVDVDVDANIRIEGANKCRVEDS
jgi:hypothetical protein